MSDVILSIAVVVGTYLGSAAFAIILFRIFFPLKKKDSKVWKVTYSYSANKSPHPSTKNTIQLLSVSRKKNLFNVSS